MVLRPDPEAGGVRDELHPERVPLPNPGRDPGIPGLDRVFGGRMVSTVINNLQVQLFFLGQLLEYTKFFGLKNFAALGLCWQKVQNFESRLDR